MNHKVMRNDDVWRQAQERAATDLFNRPFHVVQRSVGAAVIGSLGECVVEFWLDIQGIDWVADGNLNNDIKIGGCRVEIKTKKRTSVPQPHFEASVNNYGDWIQKPDLFIFVSLFCVGDDEQDVNSFSHAYIVGWCYDHELHGQGRQVRIGETDPSNGIVFRAESVNICHADLRDMETLELAGLDATGGMILS